MEIDRSAWSGDGDFTIRLIGALQQIEELASIKVEDAPASRAGTGYNLLANEVYVSFATAAEPRVHRWLGVVRRTSFVQVPRLTLQDLDARLAHVEEIGRADYADEGMLQYLRTERIVPPYQTRGYKLVELVRIYVATDSR